MLVLEKHAHFHHARDRGDEFRLELVLQRVPRGVDTVEAFEDLLFDVETWSWDALEEGRDGAVGLASRARGLRQGLWVEEEAESPDVLGFVASLPEDLLSPLKDSPRLLQALVGLLLWAETCRKLHQSEPRVPPFMVPPGETFEVGPVVIVAPRSVFSTWET